MIRALVFNGGLGNQMFQYAFYLRLKKRFPLDFFAFDIELSQGCHNGYELDKVFCLDGLRLARNYRRLKKHFPRLLDNLHEVKQEYALEYDANMLRRLAFARYEGFWQSEKYFCEVEGAVRRSFRFNESLLNDLTKDLSNTIQSENYVSVHIRRGDYVQQQAFFGLCDEAYYHQSIDLMRQKVGNPSFVFFSDDMSWVRDKFYEKDAVYVDWNLGKESWQDMYLMTLCRHHIIANSSFSWWGAWLNPNKDKVVVAPRQWFRSMPNYDILPGGWLTV